MKNIAKKFISLILIAAFLFFNVLGAEAAGISTGENPVANNATGPISATGPIGSVGPTDSVGPQTLESNQSTGADSVNSNSQNTSSTASVENTDNSKTTNQADLTISSGSNNLAKNTEVGKISTGDITTAVNILDVTGAKISPDSQLSSQTLDGKSLNSLDLSNPNQQSGTSIPLSELYQGNLQTGAGSLNANAIDSHNIISFLNRNNSTTGNAVTIDAQTGKNTISKNSSVGNISTGDIRLGVNVLNLQNFLDLSSTLDLNVWSVLNGLQGNIIIPKESNVVSGASSTNTNQVASSANTSSAAIDNSTTDTTYKVNSETGNNQVIGNSAVSDIKTGSTKVSGSIANLTAAAPVIYIINVFGKWLGNQIANIGNVIINQISPSSEAATPTQQVATMENSSTGANSENLNSLTSQNDLNLKDINNSKVETNVKINASTGNNTFSENTKIGEILTGSVKFIGNTINLTKGLGSMISHFKVNIINIYGDWDGQVAYQKDNIPMPTENPAVVPAAAENTITSNLPIKTQKDSLPAGKIIKSANSSNQYSAITKNESRNDSATNLGSNLSNETNQVRNTSRWNRISYFFSTSLDWIALSSLR